MMLLGEFECSVDAKGRFRLPNSLKAQFGEGELEFVVSRGIEPCINLWPKASFDAEVTALFADHNPFDHDHRFVQRQFMSGMQQVSNDSADRILIPKKLLEWAAATDELILVGMRTHFEMWSPAGYDEHVLNRRNEFSERAQLVQDKRAAKPQPPAPIQINLNENKG